MVDFIQSQRRVVALVLAMSIGWSSIASAHATLLRSTPGAGQLIATSPSMIRLVFSEQIVGDMSSIHLVSADGTRSRLQTMVDPRDVHALVAVSPPLPSSSYRVTLVEIRFPAGLGLALRPGREAAARP
ncbi:MAG: copper resistance protein CopC [Gemmatimonadota bacterium]|nr:copper resistance protein CopC [Gemmatimonadota bacterium]